MLAGYLMLTRSASPVDCREIPLPLKVSQRHTSGRHSRRRNGGSDGWQGDRDPSLAEGVLATTSCPGSATPGTHSLNLSPPSPRKIGTNPAIMLSALSPCTPWRMLASLNSPSMAGISAPHWSRPRQGVHGDNAESMIAG